ncbi:alpha/beta fold hydrolase [Leptospira fluminis]|nr:alpha/beta hydrolase [Leptospira fluminis]
MRKRQSEILSPEFFRFRKIKLAYYSVPSALKAEKEPILFFHANGFSALTYSPIYEDLSKAGYPVYALDFMGHGLSEATDEFRDWYFFRDQVLAFLDHLGLESVFGVGHSLGGASVLLAASNDIKQRFRKLAVLDPTVLTPLTSNLLYFVPNPLAKLADKRRAVFKNLQVVERSYRMMPMYKRWQPKSFQAYLKSAFRIRSDGQFELCLPPKIEAQIFRGLRPGHWKNYRILRQQILVLSATRSDVTPPSACRKLTRNNLESAYFRHSDGSHFFPMEDPSWVSNHITRFLSGEENQGKRKYETIS